MSPLCKTIIDDKYNRLESKGKYVISVVTFAQVIRCTASWLQSDLIPPESNT